MQGPYLRKYGVASNVNFVLYGTSGKAFQTGASYAAGDIKIMVDNGAEANSATGFADEGQGYSLPVTSSELTGQRIVVYAVDQGTKIWLDTNLVIETYGHPSAMHGFDLDSTESIASSTDIDDLNNISTTDVLTQVNLSTGVSGNFALVAGLKDISTTDVLTQVNLSTGVAGNFALVAGLKDISTTDILTQVNLSTGVAGNFALVAGLKDISTTDVFTQSNAAMVNLNLDNLINIDALGIDPTTGTYLDLIMNKNGSQTFDKANDSLEAIRDRGDAEWVTNILTSTDILTQVNLSTGVAGNFALVAGLKDISTTDVLTQVNLSTGVAGNFALVAGLKDISTTDVLTQVNLSDASTFDPITDFVSGTLTWNKAMLDLTAESHYQADKTGNAYGYFDADGNLLYTLTVTTSDRSRTS